VTLNFARHVALAALAPLALASAAAAQPAASGPVATAPPPAAAAGAGATTEAAFEQASYAYLGDSPTMPTRVRIYVATPYTGQVTGQAESRMLYVFEPDQTIEGRAVGHALMTVMFDCQGGASSARSMRMFARDGREVTRSQNPDQAMHPAAAGSPSARAIALVCGTAPSLTTPSNGRAAAIADARRRNGRAAASPATSPSARPRSARPQSARPRPARPPAARPAPSR
jgi:hypothetical protein